MLLSSLPVCGSHRSPWSFSVREVPSIPAHFVPSPLRKPAAATQEKMSAGMSAVVRCTQSFAAPLVRRNLCLKFLLLPRNPVPPAPEKHPEAACRPGTAAESFSSVPDAASDTTVPSVPVRKRCTKSAPKVSEAQTPMKSSNN